MGTFGIILCIIVAVVLICTVLKYQFNPILENYENTLDAEIPENSCYSYMKNDLGWNIDHDISKYLPQFPATSDFQEKERQRLINEREKILREMESVKSKSYSSVYIDYPYTGACAARPSRLADLDQQSCTYRGDILTYDLDPVEGKYGKRVKKEGQVQMKTFNDYMIQDVGAKNSDPNDLRSRLEPNEGCYLPISDKNKFFDVITDLARFRMGKTDIRANDIDVESAKKNVRISELENTLRSIKIPVNVPLDYNNPSLRTNCRTAETSYQDSGGYHFNYLDRLDVRCDDNEVLSQFQVNHDNKGSKYTYTCCSLATPDGNIKTKKGDTKSTSEIMDTSSHWNVWDSQHNIGCDSGYLNRFVLQNVYGKQYTPDTVAQSTCGTVARSGKRANFTKYAYNCSPFTKQDGKDSRNVKEECKTYTTDKMPKQQGTKNMKNMNVKCPQDSFIKSAQLKTEGNNYFYEYKCCAPRLSN